jgi:hypothetical protein
MEQMYVIYEESLPVIWEVLEQLLFFAGVV